MMPKDERDKMLEELDDEGRDYVDTVLRGEHERVCRLSRSRLRLVASSNPPASLSKSQVNPVSISGAG